MPAPSLKRKKRPQARLIQVPRGLQPCGFPRGEPRSPRQSAQITGGSAEPRRYFTLVVAWRRALGTQQTLEHLPPSRARDLSCDLRPLQNVSDCKSRPSRQRLPAPPSELFRAPVGISEGRVMCSQPLSDSSAKPTNLGNALRGPPLAHPRRNVPRWSVPVLAHGGLECHFRGRHLGVCSASDASPRSDPDAPTARSASTGSAQPLRSDSPVSCGRRARHAQPRVCIQHRQLRRGAGGACELRAV